MKLLPKLKIGKRGNIALFIGAIVGIFIIIVAFFGTVLITHSLGYSGGWETSTRLDSIYIASTATWYDKPSAPAGEVPWSDKAVQFDPTPRTVDRWDVTQEPDIYVRVDDPIHTKENDQHNLITDSTGKHVLSAPLGDYVREIPKSIGTEQFFYYHHVYAFAVTVKTDADNENTYFNQAWMETKGEEGIALAFTVRVAFTVDPWQIVGEMVADEDGQKYTVTTAWAGVMSSSYEIIDAGFTDRTMQARLEDKGAADVLTTIGTGWEITKAEEHSSCGMFLLNEQPASNAVTTPATKGDILGIPREVLIELSGTLWPGANQPLGLPTAYDLYQTITVRVDVLTAAGFTPVSGTDPLTDPPDDVKVGPAPFLYPLFYALGAMWAEYWWLVAAVVVIILIVLVLIVATRVKALIHLFI